MEHFSHNKKWYLILLITVLIGLIIGLILGIRIAPDSSVSKMPDSIFLSYINTNNSIISLFFSRLFSFLGLMILIYATNCKPFLCFASIILIIYQSFKFGAMCAFLVTLFNLGGVINVILVFIPTHLILLFGLLGWASVCINYNFNSNLYGGNIFSKDFFCKHRGEFVVFMLLGLIACLVEAILLPVTSSLIVLK